MKKLINDPNNVVTEMLAGLEKSDPSQQYLGEGVDFI